MIPFNKYLGSICKLTREIYRVLVSFYPKGFVIMISIDKFISPDDFFIKTAEVKQTFCVIKELLYDNPMHLIYHDGE